MSRRYRDLFFDLDRTLWDFDSNSRLTLEEIYSDFGLARRGIGHCSAFIEVYQGINEGLWAAYRLGNIHKRELRSLRFYKTLEHFGCADALLSERIGNAYVDISPRKTGIMPYTLEVLEKLAPTYRLHIITNGFEEVQMLKLNNCGLRPFFTEVVTSEMAAARKPDPQVFHLAFAKSGAKPAESLMIGDDLRTDIEGARGVGMDQVYFNPDSKGHEEEITYEIRDLRELLYFL